MEPKVYYNYSKGISMDPRVFQPDTFVSLQETGAILQDSWAYQILTQGIWIYSRVFLQEPGVFCGIFEKNEEFEYYITHTK